MAWSRAHCKGDRDKKEPTDNPLTSVQNIMEDAGGYDEEEELAYQEEEFVHEAEWGPGKEAAADDEEDNTME